jgi:hypothetical protein
MRSFLNFDMYFDSRFLAEFRNYPLIDLALKALGMEDLFFRKVKQLINYNLSTKSIKRLKSFE